MCASHLDEILFIAEGLMRMNNEENSKIHFRE